MLQTLLGRKKIQKTPSYGMVKYSQNVNFEEMDAERSTRKIMDFDYYEEYLRILSNKILLWQR